MKVGLFFGSFNPIHLGHTRLASYILEHTELEEIWLVVSPNNPLKDASTLLDETVRFQMAQMATADLPGITASDFEFDLPKPNFTYFTLRALREKYPEHTFSLIIGSDNMALFGRWRNYDEILEHHLIIVYPRAGDDVEQLKQQYPAMKVLESAPLFNISATQIREKICYETYDGEWLHPDVAIFLKKNTNLFACIKKNS